MSFLPLNSLWDTMEGNYSKKGRGVGNLNKSLNALKGLLFSAGILLMVTGLMNGNRVVPFVGFVSTFASFLVSDPVKED